MMQTSLPIPTLWQDFEALCRDLFAAEWGDPETKRSGRRGQKQRGVDVYGRVGSEWRGVQCKLRDQCYGSRLRVAELLEEVEEAKRFEPPLALLVVATTAPRDAEIQAVARKLTEKAPFRIEVRAWEDLVELLHRHEDVLENHYAWDRPDAARRRELESYLASVRDKLGVIPLAAIHQHMDRCPTLDAVYTALDVERFFYGSEELESRSQGIRRGGEPIPEHTNALAEEEVPYLRARREHVLERSKQDRSAPGASGRRMRAVEFLAAHQPAVLLGPPGAGKSAFASFVALCLANERLGVADRGITHLADLGNSTEANDLRADDIWPHGALIPLFVELRSFVRDAEHFPKEHETPHAAHFLDHLQSKHAKLPLPPTFVPYLRQELLAATDSRPGLGRGRGVLLLLDGLDETPNAAAVRGQLKRTILAFTAAYPRARVLVTSRPYAYRSDDSWRLPGFADAALAPLDQRARGRFVRAWYESLARSGTLGTHEVGERPAQLLARIRSDRHLRPLAERPLLLTLLTSLHASARLGDGGRAAVYSASVELLFDRWNEVRGGETVDHFHNLVGLGKGLMLEVLQRVACREHKAQGRSEPDAAASIPFQRLWEELGVARQREGLDREKVDERKALEYLDQRAGLLLAEGRETFRFPHRSFQEFLAAEHLRRDDEFPAQLCAAVRDDPLVWREVLGYCVLLNAQKSPNQVYSIIEELLPDGDPAASDADHHIAIALGAALAESGRFRQAGPASAGGASASKRAVTCLSRIKTRLQQCIESGALTAAERIEAGEALGKLGDPRVGHRPENFLPIAPGATVALGRFPVTVQEFAAFVDEGGYEQDEECRRNGWKEPRDFALQREHPNRPVVGVSWHEARAYCRWLSEKSGDALRLPTEQEWQTAAFADGSEWPWRTGEQISPEHANYEGNVGHPTPVGCYPRGAGAQGHLDLAGNVWEWCSDEIGGSDRVFRGGSFWFGADGCRSATRDWNLPVLRWDYLGFRVALPAAPSSVRASILDP